MPGPIDALKSAYNWATSPLIPDSEGWRHFTDTIAQPPSDLPKVLQMGAGFGAGALEGMRRLTSPLNLAATAAPLLRAGAAVPEAVGALRGAGAAGETLGELNPMFTPQGGEEMYNVAKQGLKSLADPVEAAYSRLRGQFGPK